MAAIITFFYDLMTVKYLVSCSLIFIAFTPTQKLCRIKQRNILTNISSATLERNVFKNISSSWTKYFSWDFLTAIFQWLRTYGHIILYFFFFKLQKNYAENFLIHTNYMKYFRLNYLPFFFFFAIDIKDHSTYGKP